MLQNLVPAGVRNVGVTALSSKVSCGSVEFVSLDHHIWGVIRQSICHPLLSSYIVGVWEGSVHIFICTLRYRVDTVLSTWAFAVHDFLQEIYDDTTALHLISLQITVSAYCEGKKKDEWVGYLALACLAGVLKDKMDHESSISRIQVWISYLRIATTQPMPAALRWWDWCKKNECQ